MVTMIGKVQLKVIILLVGLVVFLVGSPLRAAHQGPAWGKHYFPNVELVTQDGEKVRFYDDLIKDKVFAINFIFTRCTDSCPLETAALRKVQKALGDQMGKSVVFYSISIDGDRDNPAELKAYAKKFNAGPGWTFLTGRPEDVALLRKKMGLYREDGQAETALNEHAVNILMGNERAGQWIKRSPFEETKALVRVLGHRLQTKVATQVTMTGALNRTPAQTNGEELFRSNCEACHSLGSEEGVGPGLQGVVNHRNDVWLKEWIKEPDRMIAKKDPIAYPLYLKYKQLPMPNLRLSDSETAAIIKYMAEHSKTQISSVKP